MSRCKTVAVAVARVLGICSSKAARWAHWDHEVTAYSHDVTGGWAVIFRLLDTILGIRRIKDAG